MFESIISSILLIALSLQFLIFWRIKNRQKDLEKSNLELKKSLGKLHQKKFLEDIEIKDIIAEMTELLELFRIKNFKDL